MGILAAIVIVAINPAKQLGDARNTQRTFEVNTFLNAYGQYAVDFGMFQPVLVDGDPLETGCQITATSKKICKAETPHGPAAGECGNAAINCVWSRHLVNAYISSIPIDPHDDESGTEEQAMTDYLVSSTSPGRLRVDAPNAENNSIIGAIR